MDLGYVTSGAGGCVHSLDDNGNSRFRATAGLDWIRIALGSGLDGQRGHFCAGAVLVRMDCARIASEKSPVAEASCGGTDIDGTVLRAMDRQELCGVSQSDSLSV